VCSFSFLDISWSLFADSKMYAPLDGTKCRDVISIKKCINFWSRSCFDRQCKSPALCIVSSSTSQRLSLKFWTQRCQFVCENDSLFPRRSKKLSRKCFHVAVVSLVDFGMSGAGGFGGRACQFQFLCPVMHADPRCPAGVLGTS